MGEVKYEISQNAYIKLVLHAIKHKSTSVNGVLLGRSNQNDVVEIVESVPLFHNPHLGLLPPLEIALIMIEDHYGSQGLGIVGYFHANERFDDSELGNVSKNIGDHIFRYFPQAAILLLDNKKLETLPKGNQSPVLQLYARDASKNWKLAGSDGGSKLILKEPAANIVLSDFISSKKWQDVVDFDDHLDDITKDWLNPDLFK
ncbi:ER membrane protein complex subunit 8/9 homolog [Mercurialis annua]|uniref:ER membrane protein complex subunit 8/9 homolog n=1 Tax=Mercurialis annua TaxID=3986 RepID=UPI00215E8810|nr:ER membrane protein complex subunit 8/9 homolog [Mercurialis annua]